MSLIRLIKETYYLKSYQRYTVSTEDITEVKTIVQTNHRDDKPAGLGYGFGDEGLRFIRQEMPDRFAKNFSTYKVIVEPTKLIILKDEKDINNFTQKYKKESILGDRIAIDGKKVSEDYSGIEIPTYNKLNMRSGHSKNRNLYDGLYAGDISSGCIGDPSGVKDIYKIKFDKTKDLK